MILKQNTSSMSSEAMVATSYKQSSPPTEAFIILEDGSIIQGYSFGAAGTTCAEIVFNTGMTGYQEILTDPSYAHQAVVMTYPLIGNYGITPDDKESSKVHANAFIVREYCPHPSNWKSTQDLDSYLKEHNIPGVYGVDTRMLTKKIRTKGSMRCLITTDEVTEKHFRLLSQYTFPKDVVKQVSCTSPKRYNANGKKIGIIDLGVKDGIVKHFTSLGCDTTVFPCNTDATTILSANLDAVLFSNGPGDPKDAIETIELAQNLLGKLPLFGICLGIQVLALALGANTYKLKFGHRGSNHAVINLVTNSVIMTAQNHGYAVSSEKLPSSIKITHLNVNDQTVEGFKSTEYNVHALQFHPEAGPGPQDANYIFNEWIESLQ